VAQETIPGRLSPAFDPDQKVDPFIGLGWRRRSMLAASANRSRSVIGWRAADLAAPASPTATGHHDGRALGHPEILPAVAIDRSCRLRVDVLWTLPFGLGSQ